MSEKINNRIDEFEAALLENYEPVDCPVRHRFTPGLYIREIFMPAGVTVTSMQHQKMHPFFVLQGKISVYSENDGVVEIEAPHWGITYPGTRRILRVHTNSVWITTHVTDIKPENDSDEAIQKAVDLICLEIIEQRENKLLGGVMRNNVVTKKIEQTKTELIENET